MRFSSKARFVTLLVTSALATAALASATSSATASPTNLNVEARVNLGYKDLRNAPTQAGSIVRSTTLSDQTTYGTGYGLNIATYGYYIADHFEVPAGHTWVIENVIAPGFFMSGNPGSIPIELRLFNNKMKKGFQTPGTQIAVVSGYSNEYNDDFNFDNMGRRIELKAGTYWFSVRPNTLTNYQWYQFMREVPGSVVPLVVGQEPTSGQNYGLSWIRYSELSEVIGHNLAIVINGTDKY